MSDLVSEPVESEASMRTAQAGLSDVEEVNMLTRTKSRTSTTSKMPASSTSLSSSVPVVKPNAAQLRPRMPLEATFTTTTIKSAKAKDNPSSADVVLLSPSNGDRNPAGSGMQTMELVEGGAAADGNNEVMAVEGGWQGWRVVICASVYFFFTLGLVYSFGVIQQTLIAAGAADTATLGWISSLTVIPMPILSVPFTKAVARYGNRAVASAGAICVSVGYACLSTSWHATAHPKYPLVQGHLGLALEMDRIAIFGLMLGVGYGLVFFSTSQIAVGYFKKKRGLVVGIVYSASGFGGAVCAIAVRGIADRVGLAWSVRILGITAGVVMLPLAYWLVPHQDERRKRVVEAFRLSLFRDARFNLLLFATALGTFPLFVPPFLLPTYAASAGFSPNTGAWLVAGYSLASAVGRVGFGMVADTRVGPVTSLMLALTLASISILAIWTVSTSLATLALAMVLNGASSGALLSLQPPVNAAIFGVHMTALTMVSSPPIPPPPPTPGRSRLLLANTNH